MEYLNFRSFWRFEHMMIIKVKSPSFHFHTEVEINNIFHLVCLNDFQEKQCVQSTVSPAVSYDVIAALLGNSCSTWIFRRISVTVRDEFYWAEKMPQGQKFDIFSFLIFQIYSNCYQDCKKNVKLDYVKGQL